VDVGEQQGHWRGGGNAWGSGGRLIALVVLGAGATCALCVLFVVLVTLTALGGLALRSSGCESEEGVALPSDRGVVVAATVYSGTGPGAYGAGLAGHYSFAELGLWSEADTDRGHADRIGLALGLDAPLAPFARLLIRAPNGRTVLAEKRDVGMGGPPIDGHQRAIDLWTSTREALGLAPSWSGLVRVEAGPVGILDTEASGTDVGRAVSAEGAAPDGAVSAGPCVSGSVPATELGGRIVRIARRQLGVSAHPAGTECTIYGPCEAWCTLFATWVWRSAGVPVPVMAFSGDLYDWALRRGWAHPPSARPQPGWAVLFGSGPADPSTSLHVAIVESVLPGGQITLINGNFADSVMRTGPCRPADAEIGSAGGCEEPGPIYGYAAPE